MKQVQSIYKKYLKRIGRIQEISLGAYEPQTITREDNQFFTKLLEKQLNFNRNVIIVYISMLCVLFGIGVLLIFYHLNSPEKIGLIFGGTFLSLLTIIEKLRRLWRDKSIMDITLNIAQGLPPEQTAQVIEALYFNSVRKSK